MFANEILICFFLPMHLGLHRMYHLFTTIIHQGVRTAYSVLDSWILLNRRLYPGMLHSDCFKQSLCSVCGLISGWSGKPGQSEYCCYVAATHKSSEMAFVLAVKACIERESAATVAMCCSGGHAGYEMAPFIPTAANLLSVAFNGVRKGRKDFNTVQHHDMHHRYPTKHFSLYFVHWDRLCGTLHPRYEGSIFTYFPGDARRGVTTKG